MKKKFCKDLKMRVEIEDQGVELDESTNEVAKLRKRRIIYTRTFLLSFSEWETCNELPTDFDSSILRELYDDGSNGALERPRTECSVSLCSSDGSECGPLQSFRGNDGAFQELFSKWDGRSSWLKNKDSNSQRNSNPDNSSQESSSKLAGRSLWLKNKDSHSENNHDPDSESCCGDRYQFSSQNPDNDGLLQTPDFPRVSACTDAVSAPVVQVHYQLKKCDNPYRPPRMYKAKNDEVKGTLKSGKYSTVTTLSNEQQNEKRSVKQSTASNQQDDTESIHDPHINVNIITMNLSSYEEVSEDLDDSSTPSFGAINKSEACVDQENELTDGGADQVTGGMKVGVSDQEYGGLTLKELSFCAIEVESGASAILSKNHIVEADNTLGPTLHRNELTPLVEEENAASGRSSGKRKGIVKVNGGYNGIVTGHSSTEVSAGRNGPIDNPMASTLPNTTYENSEQTYSSLTTTETPGILIFAVEQPILSDGHGSSSTVNHPAKEQVSEMEYEQLNFANSTAFSEQNMGFSLRPHCKEIESRNIFIQRNTRDTETPEVTLGMDFLKELSSDEPAFSIQIGSFDPNTRQDNSKPCGTKFQDVDDDFLISILDNSGAFEMCGEDTRAITFSVGTEINEIEDDQSDYEEVWDKILSMLRTEQESESSPLALSDKTVHSDDKVCSLDEDSLVAIDSTLVYDGSKFMSNAAPVLPTEEEQNLPPSPEPDKIADFDLPDEDSLITIEDLIAPLSLESLKIENMVKTDKFTSEVVPNEKATVRHLSPSDHVHLQKSRLQSQESKMKTGQTQLSSQINFQDPKTDQGHTPPPVCCSCNDEHTLSWKSLAAKPNIFENTICYSVLEQPRNLRQQSQLHKSVTFPGPVKLLGCYKHELCTYFYPLNYLQRSYQGSGMPNPDFCRFGGNNGQAIVNGFAGTNLEARSMHPYIAGYGQDLSNQSTPGFHHR